MVDGLVYLVSNGIICNSLSCSKILANKDGCIKIGTFTKIRRIQCLTPRSGIFGRGDTEKHQSPNKNFGSTVGLGNGAVDAKV